MTKLIKSESFAVIDGYDVFQVLAYEYDNRLAYVAEKAGRPTIKVIRSERTIGYSGPTLSAWTDETMSGHLLIPSPPRFPYLPERAAAVEVIRRFLAGERGNQGADAPMPARISVKAIDIGFDPRQVGNAIRLPSRIDEVAFDGGVARGTRAEIAETLEAAGYVLA